MKEGCCNDREATQQRVGREKTGVITTCKGICLSQAILIS